MAEILKTEMATERTIHPARNLLGTLRLPGDKSISHRYALLSALAEGVSRFHNFSTGADCASSLACVAQMGAKVTRTGDTVQVEGCAGRFTPPGALLDCGNSGSTMRMLAGLLAAQSGEFTLEGDASLNRRPMERVRKPLLQMGASMTLTDGHAPMHIQGAKLRGISYDTPVPSAQVKTALLFAGLQAEGTTTVTEAVRTRDHGELALRAFGAEVARTNESVSITGGQALHGMEAMVPGDMSSAAFFLCAAALFPGVEFAARSAGYESDARRSARRIGLAGRQDPCTEPAGK